MYGLPLGVIALNDVPYNVEGAAAFFCHFSSPEQASEVIRRAFGGEPVRGISVVPGQPLRARVSWTFRGATYIGDVLIDAGLKPRGFCIEVHTGYMVFNLRGEHIPVPRFPPEHPVLQSLVY